MAKLTIPTIQSGYLSTAQLNEVLQLIAAAIENTLSRDGLLPNQMEASIDMNGQTILNVGFTDADNSVVSYATVKALASGFVVQRQQAFTGTNGQTVIALTDFTYTPGANNVGVYVNGVRLFAPQYAETNGSTITLASPLTGGEFIVVRSNDYYGTLTPNAPTNVPWSALTGVPATASTWPTWSQVTDKPNTFTPSAHNHAAGDITSGRLVDARRGVHVQSGTPTASTVGELWFW